MCRISPKTAKSTTKKADNRQLARINQLMNKRAEVSFTEEATREMARRRKCGQEKMERSADGHTQVGKRREKICWKKRECSPLNRGDQGHNNAASSKRGRFSSLTPPQSLLLVQVRKKNMGKEHSFKTPTDIPSLLSRETMR